MKLRVEHIPGKLGTSTASWSFAVISGELNHRGRPQPSQRAENPRNPRRLLRQAETFADCAELRGKHNKPALNLRAGFKNLCVELNLRGYHGQHEPPRQATTSAESSTSGTSGNLAACAYLRPSSTTSAGMFCIKQSTHTCVKSSINHQAKVITGLQSPKSLPLTSHQICVSSFTSNLATIMCTWSKLIGWLNIIFQVLQNLRAVILFACAQWDLNTTSCTEGITWPIMKATFVPRNTELRHSTKNIFNILSCPKRVIGFSILHLYRRRKSGFFY